jgi:hypothetical protein
VTKALQPPAGRRHEAGNAIAIGRGGGPAGLDKTAKIFPDERQVEQNDRIKNRIGYGR